MLGTQKEHEYPYQPGTFFIVPFDIFERGLSPRAFRVYCVLARFTDEHGQCFPSRETIKNMCGGISFPTVDKALKELEDKLLISIDHRFKDNKQTTNLYTLYDLADKKEAMKHLVKQAYTPDGELLSYFEYY